MAAMDSRLIDFTSGDTTSPAPPAIASDSPVHSRYSLSEATCDVFPRRQHRHSKKLSINFPILVPHRGTTTPDSHTASPVVMSAHTMNGASFFSPSPAHSFHNSVPSTVTLPMPLTPPSERSEDDPLQPTARARSKSKSVNASGHTRQESTSTEFLTLLASQERKVLELREELSRAETELTALKKQWALYEAGKKKDEIKGTPLRMGRVVPAHNRAVSVMEHGTGLGLSVLEEPPSETALEAERDRKKREITRDRMMGRWTTFENGQITGNNTKRTGQRVFSGSRHTRALSLLTTTTANTRCERTGSVGSLSNTQPSAESTRQSSIDGSMTPATTASASAPTVSRTNSGLEGLNFGKTYKDLATAASRKNLPPGLTPEQFVKQGKQVVDGVRDGLWNFFEDIRQATVGDEAIHGTTDNLARQHSSRHQHGAVNSKLRRTTSERGDKLSGKAISAEDKDSSFWKEFGMDTPKSDKSKKGDVEKRPSLPGRWPSTKVGDDFPTSCCPKHGHDHGPVQASNVEEPQPKPEQKSTKRSDGPEHHESKSSTDSRNPPSLLADLLDEEDDSWENWESATDQDPGSPAVGRRTFDKHEGVKGKEVQWHDLMS